MERSAMANEAGASGTAAGLAALGLAEAMAARLCHDLGGPLGGLAGALEVAMEDAGSREEALAIATEGAAALARRLRLLRAAWGGSCGPLDAPALARLAEGLPPRVTPDLSGLGRARLGEGLARLALNLLLLGAESLPRGGVLRLSTTPAGLEATLDGPGGRWPALLSGPTPEDAWRDASPRTLQGPLTAMMARAAGLRLVLADAVLMAQAQEGPGVPPMA